MCLFNIGEYIGLLLIIGPLFLSLLQIKKYRVRKPLSRKKVVSKEKLPTGSALSIKICGAVFGKA
jgi:hypothetical protein